MKKIVKKKKWRLNVVIYYENVNPNNYRPPIHDMMKHFAWLHELDYSISEEYPFSPESDSDGQSHDNSMFDLIYFRSTKNTRIQAKDFRKLISDTFGKSFLPLSGIDLGCQICKYLSKYPFPKNYYHPLNYPYVEGIVDGEKKIYIPSSYAFDVLADKQDFQNN